MPDTPEKFFDSIKPFAEKLGDEIEKNPTAAFTGIIFSKNPPCVVHLTNVLNQGDDLIRLHIILSQLVAAMQLGVYDEIPFKEFLFGLDKKKPAANPLEIGDELAKQVLITGMDESRIQEVTSLARRYILARGT